jgi:hypothetical protein
MFHITDAVQLQADEHVKALWRKHVAALWGKLALAALFLIIPFFFLFALLRSGGLGVIVFALLVAIGLFLALRAFLLWDADVLILTNTRLVRVHQRGLWNRVVSELALAHVRDVEWRKKGIGDAILRTGVLRVRTGMEAPTEMVFYRLYRPDRAVLAIQTLRSGRVMDRPVELHEVPTFHPAIDRRQNLRKLIETADEEVLRKIEEAIK